MKRNDVDKSIFDKLDSYVFRVGRLGKVMIMGDSSAHINSKDFDFVQNETNDILDDYATVNKHRKGNTFMPQSTNEYGKKYIRHTLLFVNEVTEWQNPGWHLR